MNQENRKVDDIEVRDNGIESAVPVFARVILECAFESWCSSDFLVNT